MRLSQYQLKMNRLKGCVESVAMFTTAPLVQVAALDASVHEVGSHDPQRDAVVAVCTDSTRGGLLSASGGGSGRNQLGFEGEPRRNWSARPAPSRLSRSRKQG